ncbi:hypothetical protein MJI46_32175, partial [Salmonella enterica subsp. enterica serovar Cerro]|nr:hypothetical protein [Salmonella enterica subsp. enterica serovar Cerro]
QATAVNGAIINDIAAILRQRTVYDAIIDKVAGYRGVAIDNAAMALRRLIRHFPLRHSRLTHA